MTVIHLQKMIQKFQSRMRFKKRDIAVVAIRVDLILCNLSILHQHLPVLWICLTLIWKCLEHAVYMCVCVLNINSEHD